MEVLPKLALLYLVVRDRRARQQKDPLVQITKIIRQITRLHRLLQELNITEVSPPYYN